MDDLTKICYKLEECSKHKSCCGDKIVCTKKFLNAYISDEHNRLLKLKVELKNSYESENTILLNWPIVLSSSTLGLTIASNVYGGKSIKFIVIALIIVFLLMCRKIGALTMPKDFKVRKKWRKYIEVVLEDMEKF